MKLSPALPFLLLPLLGASALLSAEVDPDLPQPFDPAIAQTLVDAPPFTRSLNLSDSLVLTGIAYIDGKPVATILNKEKKESYVVSEVPNAQGWKLAETNATVQLNRTQAKIMVGAEIVTVRYSTEQLSPETMKKGGFKPGGAPQGEERRGDGPRREGPRPSEEDRKRFMSLSDKGREKFMEKMRDSKEKMINASPEERMSYAKKVFEKIEADDKNGKN